MYGGRAAKPPLRLHVGLGVLRHGVLWHLGPRLPLGYLQHKSMALFGPISVVPWSLLVGILEGSPLAITDGVWIRIDSGENPQALPHITS